MTLAEIKIEDFKEIVEEINTLNNESDQKLNITHNYLSDINNTLVFNESQNLTPEHVKELKIERDEFKTLADSLIGKLNSIENDFFKEKEDQKKYYEKQFDIEELDYLKDKLMNKENLILELKKEMDFTMNNFEQRFKTQEEKTTKILKDLEKSNQKLQEANKDVIEIKLRGLVDQAESQITKEKDDYYNNNVQRLSCSSNNYNLSTKNDLYSNFRNTKGITESILFSTLEAGDKALRTGGLYSTNLVSNKNGMLNDFSEDINPSYLDTLEGHSEHFLRLTKVLSKQKGNFTIDRRISEKIELALGNIREAGMNMVQTLGFTRNNPEFVNYYKNTSTLEKKRSQNVSQEKSMNKNNSSLESIENPYKSRSKKSNQKHINFSGNDHGNYDSLQSQASKHNYNSGSLSKNQQKQSIDNPSLNKKSSKKDMKGYSCFRSGSNNRGDDKMVYETIAERLRNNRKESPIISRASKSRAISSRNVDLCRDTSLSYVSKKKNNYNVLSVTAREIENDKDFAVSKERETTKDYYNNKENTFKDKQSVCYNFRNILRKKSDGTIITNLSINNSSISKNQKNEKHDRKDKNLLKNLNFLFYMIIFYLIII